MHCPVCKVAMVTLEVERVEVDHCVRCRGVWLDRGELALLLGAKESDEEIARLVPAPDVTEAPRDCPICDKAMEKTRAADSGVVLDRCAKGDGLWLDAGELGAIVKADAGGSGGRVQRLLAEMFGEQSEID